jgi:uncharacterized protein YerC
MSQSAGSLYEAILTCANEDEVRSFIADLLSAPEIRRAEERWEIAQTRIETACSIRAAREQYKASQELVRRVFAAVDRKGSGYRLAFRRLTARGRSASTRKKQLNPLVRHIVLR